MKTNYKIEGLEHGSKLRDKLYKIRYFIKELGHILYNYKNLNNPETGSNFYNSYNHYYRMAKLAIEAFENVKSYGTATDKELNPEIKWKVRKQVMKINNFCSTLEAINSYVDLSRQVSGSDQEQIENLSKKLNELIMDVYQELANKNYFVLYDDNEDSRSLGECCEEFKDLIIEAHQELTENEDTDEFNGELKEIIMDTYKKLTEIEGLEELDSMFAFPDSNIFDDVGSF